MKNFKYLLLIASAFAISPFYSCQDESINEPQPQTDTVYASNRRPVSKVLVAKKYSTVESLTDELDESIKVTYKTIKLRNKDHSIMQEWFLENYRENVFGGKTYPEQEPNPDILSLGRFYSWENFGADTPYDCNDLFSKRGFHIPTERDVENLVAIYGDANKVRDMLGFQNPDLNRYLDVYRQERTFEDPSLRNEIFVDPKYLVGPNPQNRPKTWGVSVFFGANEPPHDLVYIIPNNEEYCLVRFMRNLTEDEW